MVRAMTEVSANSTSIHEMIVSRRSREHFAAIQPAGYRRAERALERAEGRLAGRAIWHVSYSSPDGDGSGVAEMLRSLLGYTRDSGLDAHWLGASADHGFTTVSRRIYHRLYGSEGDGGPLEEAERQVIESVATEHAELLGRAGAARRCRLPARPPGPGGPDEGGRSEGDLALSPRP